MARNREHPFDAANQEAYFDRVIRKARPGGDEDVRLGPADLRAIVRAALFAVVPGRQRTKNFGSTVSEGCKAGARALARRLK